MTLIYAPHPDTRQKPPEQAAGTKFTNAEEAWFWCVRATEARHGGARPRAGMASTPRPCEAVDIQNVLLRLARHNILTDAHLGLLGRYGRLQLRPGSKTAHDLKLWQQAMDRLGAALRQKGIVT
jgi:hypothetical protein